MGGAESLRAGPVGHDFRVVVAVLCALCVYRTECRKGLTHGTSLPIPCLPEQRLCHCGGNVRMCQMSPLRAQWISNDMQGVCVGTEGPFREARTRL